MTNKHRRILPQILHAPAEQWTTEAQMRRIRDRKIADLTYLVNKAIEMDGTAQDDGLTGELGINLAD